MVFADWTRQRMSQTYRERLRVECALAVYHLVVLCFFPIIYNTKVSMILYKSLDTPLGYQSIYICSYEYIHTYITFLLFPPSHFRGMISLLRTQSWKNCSNSRHLSSRFNHHEESSFEILVFSRINFPSLYFWLSSKASSYFQPSRPCEINGMRPRRAGVISLSPQRNLYQSLERSSRSMSTHSTYFTIKTIYVCHSM